MTDFARYYLRLSPAGLRTCLIGLVLACAAFGGDNTNKNLSRAEHALKSGDFQRAEQIYRELLAKDDQNIQARLGLSRTLLKERRLQDSFDHAARVIAIDPLSARAHALLGAAVLAAGDFRLSVEEFRTALSLNENEAIAIAGLAMIDYYENRTYPCIVGLRRAASIDPDEPDYVFNLGQAAARSERYKEAADAYERFLVVAPRTDDERRARIRGLIDFLRYLGQQGSLYSLEGPDRTLVTFESPDYRPVIKLRMNGSNECDQFRRVPVKAVGNACFLSFDDLRSEAVVDLRLSMAILTRSTLATCESRMFRSTFVIFMTNKTPLMDTWASQRSAAWLRLWITAPID